MRLSGSVVLAAPPQQVWAFLLNPAQISQCMPGLQNWHVLEENKKFHLQLAWKLSPTNQIKFPTTLEWDKLSAPDMLRVKTVTIISKEEIHSTGTITLAPQAHSNDTDLAFTAEITPPNPFLAQMIRNTAPKLIDAFFKQFKQNLS